MTEEWTPLGSAGATDPSAAVDARLQALLGAACGPVNWRTVEPGDARERWAELREWVAWFRGEFGFDHRVVPPCWYRHSALVSVLAALRDHWLCAYDPLNTPDGGSDWHRALMALEQRLREWSSRTGCAVGVHRPDMVAEYPDDSDLWETHVAADVSARADRELQGVLGVTERVFGLDEPPAGRS